MKRTRALALAVTWVLAGCAIRPDLTPPAVPLPAAFVGATDTAADLTVPWWEQFEDPVLSDLVQKGLTDNIDVRIALDRLGAARAYEAGSVAGLLPTVNATAGGGHGTGVDETKGRVDTPFGAGLNSKAVPIVNQAAGFDASWQLDLFGRTRLAIADAHAVRASLEAGRDGVRQAVAANIGEAYVRYRQAQWDVSILTDAVAVARQARDLAHDRYRAGIRNGLDAQIAEREWQTLEATLALNVAARDNARSAVAVYMGRYPESGVSELATDKPIPASAEAAPESTPIAVLQRRPDLRQAVADWQRAGIKVSDATGALFPRVALTAAVGAEQGPVQNGVIPGTHLWSVGPSMIWPILDFGALDAAIESARWQQRAALDSYKRAILNAVAEVDRHRTLLQAARDRAQHLDAAVVASQAAVQLAQARYSAGLTDFAAVADSDREAVRAQLDYSAALADAAIEFIRLHVALGGGWTADPTSPPAYRPSPAFISLIEHAHPP
jgi:NodT family efflux transporter outer membrane factor (OMF) lipoprotein